MIRSTCGHRRTYGSHVGKPSGRYKGGVPCRCSRCGQRKLLPHKPALLKRPKDGLCCSLTMKVDWYRHTGVEHKDNRCHCDHYAYTHRRGSMFCQHGLAGRHGWHSIDAKTREFAEWLDAVKG